jgi:hypothetical protein
MAYIVIGTNGPGCPRCGRSTQIRTHREIRSKQRAQPYYYSRWFYCTNRDCKTTTYMQDRDKVWNESSLGPRTMNRPRVAGCQRGTRSTQRRSKHSPSIPRAERNRGCRVCVVCGIPLEPSAEHNLRGGFPFCNLHDGRWDKD